MNLNIWNKSASYVAVALLASAVTFATTQQKATVTASATSAPHVQLAKSRIHRFGGVTKASNAIKGYEHDSGESQITLKNKQVYASYWTRDGGKPQLFFVQEAWEASGDRDWTRRAVRYRFTDGEWKLETQDPEMVTKSWQLFKTSFGLSEVTVEEAIRILQKERNHVQS